MADYTYFFPGTNVMDVSLVESSMDAQTQELGKLKLIMDKQTTDMKKINTDLKEIHVKMLGIQEKLNEWTQQLGIPLPPKDEPVFNNQVEELVVGVESVIYIQGEELLIDKTSAPDTSFTKDLCTNVLSMAEVDTAYLDTNSVELSSLNGIDHGVCSCDELHQSSSVERGINDEVATPYRSETTYITAISVPDKSHITEASKSGLGSASEIEIHDTIREFEKIHGCFCCDVFDPGIYSMIQPWVRRPLIGSILQNYGGNFAALIKEKYLDEIQSLPGEDKLNKSISLVGTAVDIDQLQHEYMNSPAYDEAMGVFNKKGFAGPQRMIEFSNKDKVWAVAGSKKYGFLGLQGFITAMQLNSLAQAGHDLMYNTLNTAADMEGITMPLMEGLGAPLLLAGFKRNKRATATVPETYGNAQPTSASSTQWFPSKFERKEAPQFSVTFIIAGLNESIHVFLGRTMVRDYDGFNGPGFLHVAFDFVLALMRDYDGFNGPGHTLRTRCL